jgi:hypothetical protein
MAHTKKLDPTVKCAPLQSGVVGPAVKIVKNIALTQQNVNASTSTVGEPSVAMKGQSLFVSGNWYASTSSDTGATWDFVDPFTTLPSVDGGFCCDQTLVYVASVDITVWLLQYVEQSGTNTLRVAVTKGVDGSGPWHWWDLKPSVVNASWKGEWFDYNHAAYSDHALYVGSNSFHASNGTFARSAVFRFPLAQLAAGAGLSYDVFSTRQNFSVRCVQGATSTMYMLSHNSDRQIRVYEWPESSSTVKHHDVNVTPWLGGVYSAPDPNGVNWLSRCDERITGAWVGCGQIGAMWSANRQGPTRPLPFVRVVRIDAKTKALIDEPDIWSTRHAYAYPDACPNSKMDVGITLFRGGKTVFPGHVVGRMAAGSPGPAPWRLVATRNGTDGPNDNKWGDYLTCRRAAPDTTEWVAVGYTLQGGGARTDVEPRVVIFK